MKKLYTYRIVDRDNDDGNNYVIKTDCEADVLQELAYECTRLQFEYSDADSDEPYPAVINGVELDFDGCWGADDYLFYAIEELGYELEFAEPIIDAVIEY